MPAVVEDVLQTRLSLVGLDEFVGGMTDAAEATGLLGKNLDSAALSKGIAMIAGGAGILTFFGRSALAAGEEAATFQRAAGNFKGAFPQDELEEFAGSLTDLTGIDDGKIGDFLGLLGTFQIPKQDAKALALPILNASEALKAQGVTAEQMAVQVGKALQTGEPTALKRSGIILDEVAFKSASAAGRVRMLTQALQAQGGDAAAAFLNTLPGQLQALDTAFGNLQEGLGASLVQPLTVLVKGASDAVNTFNKLPGPIKDATTFIGVGLAGALLVAGTRTIFAAYQTAKLVPELVKETAAHYAAANAARTHAGALQQVGASAPMGAAGGGVGTAAGKGNMAAAAGPVGVAFGLASVAQFGADMLTDSITQDPERRQRAKQGTADILGLGVPIGLTKALFFNRQEGQKKTEDPQQVAIEEQRKTNELLQRQLDTMTQGVVSTREVPLYDQNAAIMLGRIVG